MSSEKSVVILPQPPKHLCPICGKAAYSLGGIHPQCAIQQADEPRIVKLAPPRRSNPRLRNREQEKWKKRLPMSGAGSQHRRVRRALADINSDEANFGVTCVDTPDMAIFYALRILIFI